MESQTQSGKKANGHPRMGIRYVLTCGHHKFISRPDQTHKGRTGCPKGCGNVRYTREDA